MASNEGFFAGFDSATVATQYFHSLKEKTELECILSFSGRSAFRFGKKFGNQKKVWEIVWE